MTLLRELAKTQSHNTHKTEVKRYEKADPEMIDKENPEWTNAMFAKAKPASEVFPDLAAHSEKSKRGQRGQQKRPRKVLIASRLEIISPFPFPPGESRGGGGEPPSHQRTGGSPR